MHAVVVRVNIDDPEAASDRVREELVPRVSQAPGCVAHTGRARTTPAVFETEEAATNAEERVRANMPDAVTHPSSEIREVVANA